MKIFEILQLEIKRLYFYGSVISLLLLIIIYFNLSFWTPTEETKKIFIVSRELGLATIPNIIPVILLFLLTFFSFGRLRETQEEQNRIALLNEVLSATGSKAIFERFSLIPWSQYFENAANITIIVHYFDSWITHNSDQFRKYFRQGGRIKIIVPNESSSYIKAIKERFPEYSISDIKQKIGAIEGKLHNVSNGHGSKTTIEIIKTDLMIWYSALLFDNRYLVISPYEHQRRVGIGSPSMIINLSQSKEIENWINAEIKYLETNGNA